MTTPINKSPTSPAASADLLSVRTEPTVMERAYLIADALPLAIGKVAGESIVAAVLVRAFSRDTTLAEKHILSLITLSHSAYMHSAPAALDLLEKTGLEHVVWKLLAMGLAVQVTYAKTSSFPLRLVKIAKIFQKSIDKNYYKALIFSGLYFALRNHKLLQRLRG